MDSKHQKRSVMAAMLACAVFAALSARAADPVATVHVVSEAGAQQVLAAAEREALRLKAPCAIAVVDRSGILVAFLRMDGVREGSPELAIGKARTSPAWQPIQHPGVP